MNCIGMQENNVLVLAVLGGLRVVGEGMGERLEAHGTGLLLIVGEDLGVEGRRKAMADDAALLGACSLSSRVVSGRYSQSDCGGLHGKLKQHQINRGSGTPHLTRGSGTPHLTRGSRTPHLTRDDHCTFQELLSTTKKPPEVRVKVPLLQLGLVSYSV